MMLLALAFASPQPTPAQEHVESAHHDFHDANHWATIFESPDRIKWQEPDSVVGALNLKPGETVVDIGAGTGFFTRRFAKAVAPKGHAIGLDIEPSMVRLHESRREEAASEDYEARLVKPDDPALAPHSVDVVFFCDTLHHIDESAGLSPQAAPRFEAGWARCRHRLQKGSRFRSGRRRSRNFRCRSSMPSFTTRAIACVAQARLSASTSTFSNSCRARSRGTNSDAPPAWNAALAR